MIDAAQNVRERKKALRKELIARSLALPQEYREKADSAVQQNLLYLSEYRNASTVFCFVGIEHEINTRPFLQQVIDDGRRLAVPLCTGKGIMEARQVFSLDELKRGYYGLFEPNQDSPTISMEEVNFAVIPCVTADHNGNRLGHGGGYYDILFNQYPDIPAAVICREKIIMEQLPLESFDHRFPITVTEAGIFRSSGPVSTV
ncbi:MAG: 5-formyltetrahydrofolate cyclo-ligase [Eubacteriales bacterium]|jgi:5-formyltetrahydrofolate cyclo-ligase